MVSLIQRELEAVRAAVMFFTRIPLPSARQWDPESLQRAAAYFPFIGWIVGSAAAGVFWGATHLWSAGIASALSLATTLLLTGAFHEDAFADVCDGFGGGTSRDRVLEIMRDSRVGAFGAIGIAVMLLLKWQCVASLPAALAPAIIVAAHAVSRGVSGLLIALLDYASETGKSKPLATRLRGGRLALSLVFALAPMALIPVPLIWSVFAPVATCTWMGWRFQTRIGGYTGDCLGAAQQVAEVAFYLAVLALAR